MLKKTKKKITHTLLLLRRNYLISIFIVIALVAGLVYIYKSFIGKSEYFYARVRVDYPSSYYSKPDVWLASSLKQGDKEYSLLGGTDAQIINTRYYSVGNANNTNVFSIFLTLKLSGNFNKSKEIYTFQRTPLSVGSAISLNFSSGQIEGTVIELSPSPMNDKYVNKTVTLIWRTGYSQDFPYFYNNLPVGDKYFDGKDYVFEVLSKNLERTTLSVPDYLTGQVLSGDTTVLQNIIITARLKVLEKDGQLIYGGDQILKVGNNLNISTQNFNYNFFVVSNIQ